MTVTTQTGRVINPRAHRTPQILMGGSVIEGIGGIAGVVLSIIGLAGVRPGYMAAIAAIALGVAFVIEGGAVASRYSNLLHAEGGDRAGRLEIGGGTTAEFIGGAAGVVLGVLALLGIQSAALLEVAAIVFGATLLISAGSTSKLNSFYVFGGEHQRLQEVADESVKVASGAQGLAGIAAIVLGILALIGMQPVNLTLVAFLVVGASQLLSGAAGTAKMASIEQASTT